MHGLMRLPNEIALGPGALHRLTAAVSERGRTAFIVADPAVAALAPCIDAIERLQAHGITVQLYTHIVPELPSAVVSAAAREAQESGAEVIVGIGGGSALDLAKFCALLTSYSEPIEAYLHGAKVPGKVKPLIAIPATAGTGSEVTPVAVVKDEQRGLKVGVSSPYLVPDVAICDPIMTQTCPPNVTAHSGIDALTHALEGLTAAPHVPDWNTELPLFVGSNSLSDPLGVQAAATIGNALATAVNDPQDEAARTEMMRGAVLAGVAFAAAGTHISHALQYPVGELTGTTHGEGVGLFLPYVLQHFRPAIDGQLAQVARAQGLEADDAGDDAELASALIASIVTLRERIGIAHTLADMGLAEDQLPAVASAAAGITRLTGNAPAPVDEAVLLHILTRAWNGDLS